MVEDTTVVLEVVRSLFGETVALIVDEVTKRDAEYLALNPDLTKSDLKELERIRLTDTSADAHTFKLADILSNAPSMQIENPERFESFIQEKVVLFNTLDKAHPAMKTRLQEMFNKMSIEF